ncbi:MAG: 16S rRNA (guanine(527)-N(7))-methyltransferase [uncultured Rubrobacteraceae bacterium]|uniref:Ribosomal RNA small subunit methyltransferase G n=1 Tax=uncultured Rubrobacteraceae bacterium TaxID=349277 RepID=A0A6J4QXJ5_9ACTN|nr:MAG: 16S rRNA (guanine(527)-N(7))-methyltransferase [uncultured Rubrobacteraceae bacterium]
MATWGLRLGPGRREHLLEYARLLASYDRANVIGTRDVDGILLAHVLDSLSCFLHEPLLHAGRLADVGSGGGLPGIPIKIMKPDLTATLVESTGKKAAFLQYALDSLVLDGAEVTNTRVEDLGLAQAYRGTYDVVTSRAVARLSVVAEYCVPLLRSGGWAIAMKGGLEQEELSEGSRAVDALGARVAGITKVPMMSEVGEKERNLIILEKVRETPARYPRRPGVVAKRPLGVG